VTDPIDPNAYPPGYGWGMPPSAGPPSDPPVAPARASQPRTVLLVVGILVLAVAATAVITSLLVHDDKPQPLAVPESFDGYTLLHNAASQRVEDALHSFASSVGGPAKTVFDSGTIGVYGRSDAPNLIVFALRTDAVAARGSDASTRVDQLLGQLLPDPASFPAGRHGGSEKCGITDVGAVTESACAWSDSKTTGMIVAVNPPLAPSRAAAVTLALREVVDK
jgi:hypothetical protein